ncbi:MAG TPA: CRTAC1 family protein, partial [Verrucomicrobiota bacterium]|nr:CRTAC1 family protein [Verrucomicrobiota bacterium]
MPRLTLFLLLASSCFALAAAPAWRDVPGGRLAPLSPAGRGEGFAALEAASLGLAWTNRLPVGRYAQRQNLMNGSGLAAADVDGDGLPDLFFAGKTGGSALFKNLGGWRFTNLTGLAGVALTNLLATGAVFGDVNGDGRPDLFVTSFNGPDALLLNLGGGRFTNVTAAAGVASPGGSTSAAFADLDGDGHLDLYVCRFGVEAILRDGATVATRTVGGRTVVTGRFARRLAIEGGRIVELGEPDALFFNDGRGGFRPAVWREHFFDAEGRPFEQAPPDFGLAVQIRDINGDGHPDIYVCNDFQTPDRLWLGDGRGRFREAPALTVRNMAYASMGVDFADLDRDGRLDFIAVEMLSRDPARHLRQASPMSPAERNALDPWHVEAMPRNVLQWNRGDGTYAEIAWFAGVAASDWSWTPIFLDVDLDGFEDLLVSNGHLHDVNDRDGNAARPPEGPKSPREAAEILLRYPRLDTPNAAWRNRGDLTFEDRAAAWGFHSAVITHGLALADLDGDGDLDVIGNGHDSPPLIYRNEAVAPRVAVRLRGRPGNPTGVGAVIRVTGGPAGEQQQEMLAGGRYLSADEPLRVFAAGAATNRLAIRVDWPGGRRSELRDVPANSLVEVDEAAAVTVPAPPPAAPGMPWFVAETNLPPALVHTQAEVN